MKDCDKKSHRSNGGIRKGAASRYALHYTRNGENMPFDIVQMQEIEQRYLCAKCFSHLEAFPIKDQPTWILECPDHGDIEKGSGRITKWFAEKLGQRAILELDEVRQNLRDLLPYRKPRKPEEIIAWLGY